MTPSIIPERNAKASKSPPSLRRIAVGAGVALFWLLIWEGLALLVRQELLIPTPMTVLATLGRLIGTPLFWKAAGLSMLRVAGGFLAAVAAGSLTAVLTARFPLARALLAPLLHIVRAAPVASFIILALVWFRTDVLPVFIAFLMVMPLVWANVEKGIREIDRSLLEMAKVYRFGRLKTLTRVQIPSVMPYFLTACTTGLGFAWKSGIAAEVICRPDLSIGRQLQDAKIYLETPEVFAWTATVVVLSMLLEKGLRLLAGRLGRRYNAAPVRRGSA